MEDSRNLPPLLDRALAFLQMGELARAEDLFSQILDARPDDFDARHLLGVVRYEQGRNAEALELISGALKTNPNHAFALNNRGNALLALGGVKEALASYDRALAIKLDFAEAYCNRGNALQAVNRVGEALVSYDKALAIKPDYVAALCNRGDALQALRRFAEALASYDQALAIKPDLATAHNNRGVTLLELERHAEALASTDKALAIKPDLIEAHNNRGRILEVLKRYQEALLNYDKALAIKPDYVEALHNRGNALHALKRHAEALASLDKALAIRPDSAAFNSRGNALLALNDAKGAVESYDKAVAIQPDYAEGHYNRGVALQYLKRFQEAVSSFDKALAIEPGHRYALAGLANSALNICDFTRTAKLLHEIEAHVKERKSIIMPVVLMGYNSDLSLQLECARNYVQDAFSFGPEAAWDGRVWRNDKLRIAYLSADFRRHPTAYLMAELFEIHDRSRFEVLGVSFGTDDGSIMRSRLIKAFDQFHDVRGKSDREVAKLLNDLKIDIAIDLAGYTQNCRPGILAHRPAPIQVSYIGYLATMGADFIDYVIADQIVVPIEHQPFYTEKIVHLPDCFQVNDSRRAVAAQIPSRRDVCLPDKGFVFCCFNNNYKITAPIFDIWMRLLRSVEGSILWLTGDNVDAERNLRKEAAGRGVDPARLVFAARVDLDQYVARLQVADIFLDTLPYNAGATASDALWAGLPVLSWRGESFSGRMGASLLQAVGLPELVTQSAEDYEALALKLAFEPSLLQSIRRRLEQNRSSCPLFDTNRFRRHIEAAYAIMWQRWQRGGGPRSFSVAAHVESLQSGTSLDDG